MPDDDDLEEIPLRFCSCGLALYAVGYCSAGEIVDYVYACEECDIPVVQDYLSRR